MCSTVLRGAERVGTPQAWPHTCLTLTLAPPAASEPEVGGSPPGLFGDT